AQSGRLLYYYLVYVLHVPIDTAEILALAVKHKDTNNEKHIYQKIIHDADCLDIMRVQWRFDATYLDFYKTIASKNPIAFDEMAKLITEVRSIIAVQGDSCNLHSAVIKKQYEHSRAYA